ncbi:Gfo/Idh/MocA family protein [Erysipelothrix urinaevulpis]|uniref:Gfo/Idh/MocA family protein n=1 Tax=Erysipelothrix urinaevulpis TaxID=2683717 RepID=UPI0013573B8C|nr:Gfo/Idh/MocA family oxidoreductase [Erysipelothrix urinaevulpis]
MIKVGFIGCGKIFYKHCLALEKVEGVKIVAMSDCNFNKAKVATSLHGGVAYSSYAEMLKQEKIDVVHVCTPTKTHYEISSYCLEHGISVIVESPLEFDAVKSLKIMQKAQENDVNIYVVNPYEHIESHIKLMRTMEEGILGEILGGRLILSWKKDSQQMPGVMSHSMFQILDYVNQCIELEIKDVNFMADRRFGEVYDVLDGIIRYKNDSVLAVWANSYASMDYPMQLEIECEKGLIKLVGNELEINRHDHMICRENYSLQDYINQDIGISNPLHLAYIHALEDFYHNYESYEFSDKHLIKTQMLVANIQSSLNHGDYYE